MSAGNKSTIELPINLSLALGAYTTKIWVGSDKTELNVLLDTGSSTLAIDAEVYQAGADQSLQATQYAQSVVYGKGGWAGPVIRTEITLDHSDQYLLNDAPLALTKSATKNDFQNADGIWGLAYHHLNKAYDVSSSLEQIIPPQKTTHPWPYTEQVKEIGVHGFKKYLHQFPEHDITPTFTAFEENNIINNQFALSTNRSIVYVPQAGMSQHEIAAHAMNRGLFQIGVTATTQEKISMAVVHDAYYNADLIAVRVAGFGACKAPPLEADKLNSFFSNAIIDSGCSFLVLQKQLYEYVLNCFEKLNPTFRPALEAAQQAFSQNKPYKNNQLDLSQWPILTFKFVGTDSESIELELPPQCYWQEHAKSPDNWMFMLMNQMPQWPNQTICGLPLMNNYQCIFDRSDQQNGSIHWLKKAVLAPDKK
ncbi:pepsin-like aspartyl protease [Marinicella sp. S1101]|uniref:pepsin-like aspartyl protease n=1 Tax=Marinicella marina TaxID=2996016 RepID=UPI002260ACAF|nr:pepsin-like aspartyl protease [Marinicella marina]MCX7553589.1 pepsin-like aspartyl protease [Marinicella marina]MDJ1140213.1 pepsin-like aspartyl protease [Marinicella marina]